MDLIGLSRIRSYGYNSCILVILNDYSRLIWTLFLKHRSGMFEAFKKLANVLENQKRCTNVSLSGDHRNEFENNDFT